MAFMGGTAQARIDQGVRNLFKPRDLFLHDGKTLRRFTVSTRLQLAVAAALMVLLAWSAFATIQAVALMNGDVARMERQVAAMQAEVAQIRIQSRRHAALVERRQAFLASVISGEANAGQLAALLPAADVSSDDHADAAGSYANVDEMQQAMALQARQATLARYRDTARAVAKLGLNPARFHGAAVGVGGPFEAADTENADPRFRELFVTWQRLEQLETAVTAIPSAQPVRSGANFTSGFGVRSDPFRGRAAMHGGIDLAGPSGTPIYATADGVIARSEWNSGGYGNLVEINHGQGIQTRYGHLSRLIAQPGQRIRRGELIGLMGSTGRSTGSHLHYEVRIDGRAINPLPFLQSGQALAALQNSTGGQGGGR